MYNQLDMATAYVNTAEKSKHHFLGFFLLDNFSRGIVYTYATQFLTLYTPRTPLICVCIDNGKQEQINNEQVISR